MRVWLFYNYIRTHLGLGDITPAEEAGMSIAGPNKLSTLIQDVAMSKMAVHVRIRTGRET